MSDDASGRSDLRFGQVVIWLLLAAALAAGVFFYFRYERRITPLLGRDGSAAAGARLDHGRAVS